MPTAKDIRVAPIASSDSNALVKRLHYSGTVVHNSQLHLGVFIDGRLEGAMQFGPSMFRRQLMHLVSDTKWNGFLELNRMAFSERLPRNSESRALGVACRMIRKQYPHVEWLVTFADGTQCGDGTIYRAAGFLLTGVRKNTSIWKAPDSDEIITDATVKTAAHAARRSDTLVAVTVKKGGHITGKVNRTTSTKGVHTLSTNGGASMRRYADAGWAPIPGFQMRYIRFQNPAARERLTVPVLPYSAIGEAGASMYRGERPKQAMAGSPSAQRQGSTDPDAPARR